MKLTRPIVCVCLLFAGSYMTCRGQTNAGTVDIRMSGPRPLAAALNQLEDRVGIAIDYEDVPAIDAAKIQDVASQVMSEEQRKAHPDHRILVPKGGSLSWTGRVPPAISVGAVTELVHSVVDANNAQTGLTKYAASFSNGAFFVIPRGNPVTAPYSAPSAILDTKVSFPYQERSAAQTIDLILAALSEAAHTDVKLGSAPFGLLVNSTVSLGAANDSARRVLALLFSLIDSSTLNDGSFVTRVGYRLMYDPGLRFYALNIHTVQPANESKPPRPL